MFVKFLCWDVIGSNLKFDGSDAASQKAAFDFVQKQSGQSAPTEFRRDSDELGIPTHLTPLDESAFMRAFDTGAVAIVLVSGYHMVRRMIPHWVFAFGHEGRYILVHDPVARKDDQGVASIPQTYAVPALEFERMTRFGREHLRAAVLIRKGPPQ